MLRGSIHLQFEELGDLPACAAARIVHSNSCKWWAEGRMEATTIGGTKCSDFAFIDTVSPASQASLSKSHDVSAVAARYSSLVQRILGEL